MYEAYYRISLCPIILQRIYGLEGLGRKEWAIATIDKETEATPVWLLWFPCVFIFVWDQTCLLSGLCLSCFITVTDEGHTWSVQREIVCVHQDNILVQLSWFSFQLTAVKTIFSFLLRACEKAQKPHTSNKPHIPCNHTILI